MNDFLLLTHQTAPLLPALLTRLAQQPGHVASASWGLGYFQGKGCQVFIDRHPLPSSRLASCLRQAGLQGQVALTTYGQLPSADLADLGPFSREWRGDNWLGIYLGDSVPPIHQSGHQAGPYQPIGAHRGEQWLCASLNLLAQTMNAGLPTASEITPQDILEPWLIQSQPAGILLLMNHSNLYVWTGRTVFANHDEQGFWLSSAPLAAQGHHLLAQRLHHFTLADPEAQVSTDEPVSPCREAIS